MTVLGFGEGASCWNSEQEKGAKEGSKVAVRPPKKKEPDGLVIFIIIPIKIDVIPKNLKGMEFSSREKPAAEDYPKGFT